MKIKFKMEFRWNILAEFLLLLAISLKVTANQHKFKEFEKCIAHNKVDGCSVPFNNSFPYRAVFKPACNRHDVCYRCGNKFGWSRNDCDMGFLYDMYYTCAMKDLIHKHNVVKRSLSGKNENRNEGNGKEHSGDAKKEVQKKRAAKVKVQEAKGKDQEEEGKSERSINGDSGLKDQRHEELLVKHDTASFIRQLEATKKEVLKAIGQMSEVTAEGLSVKRNGRSKDGSDSQKREANEESKVRDKEDKVAMKIKKCDNDDDTCNWVKKDPENGGEEHRDKEDGGKKKNRKESKRKDTKNEKMGGKGDAVGDKREKIVSKKENNEMEESRKEDITDEKKGTEDNEEVDEAHDSGLNIKRKKENKAEKKTDRKTKTKEEDNGESRVVEHDDGSKSKAKKEKAGMTKIEVDEDDDYREIYHDGDDKSRDSKGGKSKKEKKEKGESKIRENREESNSDENKEMKKKGAAELYKQKKMSGGNKKELTGGKIDREVAQADDDDDESKRSKTKSKHEKIKENLAKEQEHKSKAKTHHHEKHLKENGSGCEGSEKCKTATHVKTHVKEEEIENKISDKKVDDMTKKYAEIERLLKELNALIRSTKDSGHTAKHAGSGHENGHEIHLANSEEKHGESKKLETTKVETAHGEIGGKKQKPTKGVEEEKHTTKHTHSHENKGKGIKSRPTTNAHKESKNKLPQKVTTKKKVKKIDKGEKEKRTNTDQENSIFPIKSKYFNKCKLAAYLYYIAVRGFGQKYYRNEPPGWCEKFCVQESGVPNLKKYRRPRNIM